MIRTPAILRFLTMATLFLTTGGAAAQSTRTDVFLTSAAGTRVFALTPDGREGAAFGGSASVDYALFATELVAYLTKEIVRDSPEEYADSPLGSRWTRSMDDPDSRFGDHCLKIVTRIGSAVPMPSFSSGAVGAPTAADYVVRGATTALALRQVWDAFENDVQGERSGVSLRPKVSARRVGVSMTLHW